jgi:Flp pilus assembly pilin Flp
MRRPRTRRGQSMVEYGLIVAALAFIAWAGFQVMNDAQRAYFTGVVEPALNQPTPVSGNPLLHHTSLSLSGFGCSAGANLEMRLTDQLTCQVTVTDDYQQAGDRFTPLGTVYWLDSALITHGQCDLSAVPNSVPPAATCPLTYTPQDADADASPALTLSAVFGPPGPDKRITNHLPSAGPTLPDGTLAPIQILVDPDLKLTPTCTNQVVSQPEGWVEIGHPIRCTVTVTDPRNRFKDDFSALRLSWQHTTSTAGLGCFTGAGAPYVLGICTTDPQCGLTSTAPQTATCDLDYRHLYDPSDTAFKQVVTGTNAFTILIGRDLVTYNLLTTSYSKLNVTEATSAHQAGNASVTCTPVTGAITINGGNVVDVGAAGGTVSCTAHLEDTEPPPASYAPPPPPPSSAQFSPLGPITWMVNGSAQGSFPLRPAVNAATAERTDSFALPGPATYTFDFQYQGEPVAPRPQNHANYP